MPPTRREEPEGLEGLEEPIIVDPGALQPETLRRLLEEFVTRDGTDYGEHEVSLETRVLQAQASLRRGEVVIVFDPSTASVTLLRAEDAPRGR